MITAEKLREVLHYNPETGVFTWINPPSNTVKKGEVAGCDRGKKYLVIGVCGKLVFAHRLAWLYVHGEWPRKYIDHVNGDRSDNRITNLREATKAENARNRAISKSNSLGLKGITFDKAIGKYKARIELDGRRKTLGLFNCPTAAHLAYCKAAREHFGDFAREK